MTPTLREEIRQSRPFESLHQEAHLNLVRTAAVLTDALERTLKPAGLTTGQYNVLRILRGAGERGLCRNEVRDRMLTRMPDMTRLLDRMEEAGLVSRSRDGEDRRMVSTRITRRGMEVVESVEKAVGAEHRRGLGHLSREQLQTLIALLEEIRRSG